MKKKGYRYMHGEWFLHEPKAGAKRRHPLIKAAMLATTLAAIGGAVLIPADESVKPTAQDSEQAQGSSSTTPATPAPAHKSKKSQKHSKKH